MSLAHTVSRYGVPAFALTVFAIGIILIETQTLGLTSALAAVGLGDDPVTEPDIEYETEIDYTNNTLTLVHAGGDTVTDPVTYYLHEHDTETVTQHVTTSTSDANNANTDDEVSGVTEGDELVTFDDIPENTTGDVYWVRDASTPEEINVELVKNVNEDTDIEREDVEHAVEHASFIESVDWGVSNDAVMSELPRAHYTVEHVDDIREHVNGERVAWHENTTDDDSEDGEGSVPGVVLVHDEGETVTAGTEFKLAGEHATVREDAGEGDVVTVFPVTLTEVERVNTEYEQTGYRESVDAGDVHWVGDDGTLVVMSHVTDERDGERLGEIITAR